MSSVFLSYSSKDVKLATRIQELLEERGYDVFRDKDRDEGIPAGTKWAEELFLNLERFRIVVFLATPASLESRWCHTELAVAMARRKHVVQISTRKEPVHPVLAATQSIGPIRDVEELVDKLVADLGRVGLGPRDSASWDPNVSPYPGLERLTEKYAAVLFGRDDDIELVIDRLERPKPAPVLVVGPSGSGKSSLIRAGVVPELKRRPRNTVLPVVDPGDDALRSVALELERADPKSNAEDLIKDPAAFALAIERLAANTDDGRVVLVIDQAEDLVLPANRARAVELVERLQAIDRDRLAVIVVLRSASLDPWMLDTEIGALTPGDPVQIRPLDRAALREVILGPAQLAGIRIEPDTLVEQILDDTVQGEALPLLAALLQELTKNHSRMNPAVITPIEYAAVGPVSRVIERRAQAAVDDVKVKVGRFEADVVDSYLRLVAIDESRQPVRTQLVAEGLPADVAAIFGILEDYRLVTRDRRAIPISANAPATPGAGQPPAAQEILMAVHEAVFRAWTALKAAIDARLDALRIRTWLRHDAEEWAGSKRGQVSLTGGRLDLALEWSRDNADEVTPEIKAYLDKAKGQRRRGRIARLAVAGLAAVVLAVGVVAFQAVQARNDAEASRLAADARANFGTRLDLGLLLALEARAKSGDPRFQAMPLVGLSQGPGPRRFGGPQSPTDSAALSADGSRAVVSYPNVVQFWDVEANSRVAAILGPPSVSGISRDGSTVAIGYQVEDQPDQINVHSWPEEAPRLSCQMPGEIRTIAVSPTGDFVVAVLDTPEGTLVQVVSTSDCRGPSLDRLEDLVGVLDVADGRIAIGTDRGAAIWDPVSDALDEWSIEEASTVQALALGDGDRLAATSDEGDLFIWDTSAPGSAPDQFPVFADDVVGGKLRFSTDLNAWIVGSQKGDLRVIGFDDDFDVGASVASLPMAGITDNDTDAHALDIAATATGAVTVDESGRIVSWDLVGTPPLGGRVFADARIDRLRVLPAGQLIAAGTEGVWQLDGVTGAVLGHRQTDPVTAIGPGANGWAIGLSTGEVLRTAGPVDGLTTVTTVAPSVAAVAMLDSGAVAIADGPGVVTIVEPSGASTVVPLDRPILSLASRGDRLFAGANSGEIYVIDTTGTPREVARAREHDGSVDALEVSPDGTKLASGSDDRQVIIWTIGSDGGLTPSPYLLGHTDRVNSLSVSPDGHWLASAGEDQRVILWNLDTGERVGDPIPVVREPVLAFGRTGDRQLFLSDDLQGVRRWDMRPEAWAKVACDIIGGRRLEVLERLEFLGTTDATPDRCGAP